MADETSETPKTLETPKPQASKPEKQRASKGYRKFLRRQKEAARKPTPGH
jgi:hypothetical protein